MTVNSDNYHFDINGQGQRTFEAAMQFAFDGAAGDRARSYRIENVQGTRRMILRWEPSDEPAHSSTLLAYPMDLKTATAFVWGWLQYESYPPEPDHDGSNSKGWRVYNEVWGHLGDDFYAFAAIEPCWMVHGK